MLTSILPAIYCQQTWISAMTASNRLTIFIACVFVALSLLCHSPWTGYKTEIPAPYVSPIQINASCPGYMAYMASPSNSSSLEEIRSQLKAGEDLNKCAERVQGHAQALNILDWNTSAPLVEWFGPISNFAATLSIIISLAGIWLFLNRKMSKMSSIS